MDTAPVAFWIVSYTIPSGAVRVSTRTMPKLSLADGDCLTRAAHSLVHRDPERFVAGALVKIAE